MSGLFGGQLLTPQQRQETVMRKALEIRVSFWSGDHLYQSGGDLLLKHGRFWSGRKLPEQYATLRGPEGRCFENTMDACLADPTLRYVEGVYAIGQSHYTPHAWAIDVDDNMLELTLPTTDDEIARGIELTTGLPVMAPEHWGYWGAVFHPDFVRAVWETQEGHVGMLDRPAQDAGEGNTEWREDWPVLRTPYSPTRTTL